MHLGMVECHVLFKGTVPLNVTSDLVFRRIMSGAYHFYHLGWRNIPSHFWDTVTLNSDLVSRIDLESVAYLLYSLR